MFRMESRLFKLIPFGKIDIQDGVEVVQASPRIYVVVHHDHRGEIVGYLIITFLE